MSDRESVYTPSKRKKRFLVRATLGGLFIGLTSLWALTVSYDIPREDLIRFLMGSILMLVVILVAAAALVMLIKLPGIIIGKMSGRGTEPGDDQRNP